MKSTAENRCYGVSTINATILLFNILVRMNKWSRFHINCVLYICTMQKMDSINTS